jgi:hypothetical protein
MTTRSVLNRDGAAWLRWLPTLFAFPIGGFLAHAVAGPVDHLSAALVGGALTGLVLGTAQALALRGQVPGVRWVGASTVGLAAGLALATAAIDYRSGPIDLAVQGAISGAVLGATQALVLRGRLPGPWRWAPLTAAAWALGWTVTRAIGVDVGLQWTVFGSSGALLVTALTGLLPVALARHATAASAPSGVAVVGREATR